MEDIALKLDLGNLIQSFETKTFLTSKSEYKLSQALFKKDVLKQQDYQSVNSTQTTNLFVARGSGRSAVLQIKKTDNLETFVMADGFGENKTSKTELFYNKRSLVLKEGTEIDDICAVRYQIKADKKIASFIDKFILTDEKERKKYALYEKKQQFLEAKKLQAFRQKMNVYE